MPGDMKWDLRFLTMADLIATWSKDPSTKVGAVVVRPDRTICSLGYNGFPRGVDDKREFYENRDTKLARIIHAEVNAVLSAREPLTGYTLYVSVSLPCSHCAAVIIQSGISRVVCWAPNDEFMGRWGESIGHTEQMLRQASVRTQWYNRPEIHSLSPEA